MRAGFALILLVGVFALDLPNFSGTWSLNLGRSALQISAPDSTVFVIEHHEPSFKLTRTHYAAGTADTFSISLTTAGREIALKHHDVSINARLYWDGEELVFDSRLVRDGEEATNVVRYRLADEGATFIAEERFSSERLSYENLWVFDRRERG